MHKEKKKILVIDDVDEFLELMKDSLGKFFEIYVEKDVLIAFQRIEEVVPDLIIADISMPAMDGIEFVRKLQEDKKKNRIPVIIMTASSYNKTNENLLREQENVYAFLSKMTPIDFLKEKIDSILK